MPKQSAAYFVFSLFLMSRAALGADVTLDRYEVSEDGSYYEAYFTFDGPIVGDEMEQVAQLFLEFQHLISQDAQRFLEISLNSPGGSYPGGVRLMQLFAENAIATRVRAGDECLSACAIAFLGGSTVVWDTRDVGMRRLVEPGGTLGFHAPSLSVSNDGSFDAAAVASAYNVALQSLGMLVQFDFEIPRTLIEVILTTPPEDMYVLRTVDDFARWNISVDWTNSGWEPERTDIARICLQNYIWRHGLSYTVVEGSSGPDFPTLEQRVAEVAEHVGTFGGGDGGLFAYVNAPKELGELCIVALRNTSNGWRPNAMGFYIPDDTVAFEDIVRSDNMDIVIRHIDYLPFDTDVFTLR